MPVNPTYLVLGCGVFGQKAVIEIKKRFPQSTIIAVDKDRDRLSAVSPPADLLYHDDAVNYLTRLPEENFSWVAIPALPVHLAYEWLVLSLKKHQQVVRTPVPQELNPGLPLQLRDDKGSLYLSNTNSCCPADCVEADELCLITGEPKRKPLYKLLAEIEHSNIPIHIIRSFQIAPGVGGYRLIDLFQLQRKLTGKEGYHLVSTACHCHAVIDGLLLK